MPTGDGTYDSTCDSTRAYTSLGSLLSANAPSALAYMQTYWKDITGDDETFWEHEWSKHGTCISTLKPSCYTNYVAKQEAVDFFNKAVALFKTLPSYTWLSAAGIVPSSTATYTLAAIQSALTSNFGSAVTINCNSNHELDELWYHYNVQGSVQSGTFNPATPVGSGSTCPSTGIKYLPKSGTPTTTTGTTLTTSTTASTGTSVAPSGSGYLNAIYSGSQDGCIISAGTWYTSGTCATFTAAASGMSSSPPSFCHRRPIETNHNPKPRIRLHSHLQQRQVRHLQQRADLLVVRHHRHRLHLRRHLSAVQRQLQLLYDGRAIR